MSGTAEKYTPLLQPGRSLFGSDRTGSPNGPPRFREKAWPAIAAQECKPWPCRCGTPDRIASSSPLRPADLVSLPRPNVCPFDININFTTPFLYNPTQGRLLLDLKMTGISQTGELDEMDFAGSNGGIVSIVGLLNDTIAVDSSFGADVTQLRYTAVPEPASGALMLISAAVLALMTRNRSARKH